MAFSFSNGVHSGFDTRPLLSLPAVVSLPANHRLAKAPDVSLTELEKEPLIYFDLPLIRDWVSSVFDALAIQPNIGLKIWSYELMRGLVGRGHGYAVHASVPLTSTTYDGGQLVVKPLRDIVPPAQVVSITPGSHLMRPAVKIFEDFLEGSLKRGYGKIKATAA